VKDEFFFCDNIPSHMCLGVLVFTSLLIALVGPRLISMMEHAAVSTQEQGPFLVYNVFSLSEYIV